MERESQCFGWNLHFFLPDAASCYEYEELLVSKRFGQDIFTRQANPQIWKFQFLSYAMSLRLTDFGTFDEVKQIAFFTFTVSNFEKISDSKISRPFRHAGHVWRLQIKKKNGNFGMFIRWYGTKAGLETHIRCSCTTGLGFSVMNNFDTVQTAHEGNLQEDDVYDRVGSGIGYGEVIKLEKLEKTPGFIIKNKLDLRVRLKVKETKFIDKIQATLRPDRTFIRSLKFPFHGADWSFILFPNGEREEDAGEQDDETFGEKATLYLSRDSISNNPCLRHRANFVIYVEDGPSFEVRQNFHENQSLVFGTGYLMAARKLKEISKNGVVRVGVKFIEIKPYFNFAYDLRSEKNEGICFVDQRDIPWLFKLEEPSDGDGKNLEICLKIDPKSSCKQIKALETRDKKYKVTWHAKIINFQDADMSVDAWSEQTSECGLFKYAGESHCIILPVTKSQITNDDSPYMDDDLLSSVHISVLNSNFVYDATDVVMKIEELKEIASTRDHAIRNIAKDYYVREQIWKLSLEKVEEEKDETIESQKDSIEQQTTKLKEKDLIINSLEEKLYVVENYVKSLEENSQEDIGKFNEISITKLIEFSKLEIETRNKMDQIFKSLEHLLKGSSEDVVTVASIGAYGQDTVTKTKIEIDVVVFVKGELENNLNNGDIQSCLSTFIEALSAKEHSNSNDNETSTAYFGDFQINQISLQCKCDAINLNIYPTKNWMEDGGYGAIYEASTGLTKDALKCFIIATSERQAQFIMDQDEKCKDLIRIVKVWRDKIEWQSNSRPSSYLISLLVMRAYNVMKTLSIVKTQSFLKEVLLEVGFLLQEEDLRIEWNTFYNHEDFPVENPRVPFIRDPVLPSNNVAELDDWTQFRSEFKAWVTSLVP